MNQQQEGSTVRIRFPSGQEEELYGVQILSIDGRPFVPPEDQDAQMEEITRVLHAHEAQIRQHQDQINNLTTALITGQKPQKSEAES